MIYEITTIVGDMQKYEVIEVSPIKFADNTSGVSTNILKNDGEIFDSFANHVHSIYSMTGLEEAIRSHPARLITTHDGERFTHAEIAKPKKLRLIYDTFPLAITIPILKICPIEGEQIWIAEYNFKNAKLPLNNVTFSQEFGGSLNMFFVGLEVYLHLRNFEKENELYYGRNLKRSLKK